MSLLATVLPPAAAPRRRPGRRRVADCQRERTKHLLCAALNLSRHFEPDRVAGIFDVSRSTVRLWTAKALGYRGPEAEALRTLFPDAAAGRSSKGRPDDFC